VTPKAITVPRLRKLLLLGGGGEKEEKALLESLS
jgi:hypothetical protein